MSANRSVVVTGAAGGLGAEAVRLLAARDVNCVCVDRDVESLTRMIEDVGTGEAELVPVVGDVGEEADVVRAIDAAVQRWGGLDGLFNIAGTEGQLAYTLDATTENYDHVMRVNARSVWLGIKHSLPHLIARGGGAIVSTGSYLAIRGERACGAYGASKHAIVGLTKTVALEYADKDVRVNVVCPGSMDTRMIRELFPTISADPAEAEATIVRAIPHGRMAQPQELAATGVWLLLDAPAHLTGQVIMVDGGRSAG